SVQVSEATLGATTTSSECEQRERRREPTPPRYFRASHRNHPSLQANAAPFRFGTKSVRQRHPSWQRSLRRFHHADVRQVPVSLGVVEAVTNDEDVIDGEPEVVDLHVAQLSSGLVQQRA